MSGYNAEYTAPQDNEELAELPATLEPIVLEKSELEKAQELIEELRNELRTMRFADIPAHDHRLTHIWESAAEIADQKGYCGIFDEIMEELGTGFTREMEYCVTVTETVTYDVHVTGPRNATQSDIEEMVADIDLDDWSETDRDREVTNYESAD